MCELLLRILFLERDMFSCGNLCFLFKGNYFERGIFVFPFSVGVEREFESVSEVGRRMGMDGEMNDLGD